MAKHSVKMSVPSREVMNSDVDFWISTDDKQTGHLHVSRGGVDWFDGKAPLTKRSLTWERLQRLILENIDATKGTKPKRKR